MLSWEANIHAQIASKRIMILRVQGYPSTYIKGSRDGIHD